MKGLAAVTLCVIFAAFVCARPEEKYTDQYDSIDVDEILNNPRLRENYYNCIKTGKKCNREGQLLRGKIFFPLLSNNYIFRVIYKKVIRFLWY